MTETLKGKNIVLGVSGGIAAYKAVELLRLMIREGASVWVGMTDNAKQFVTPLTFEVLSGQPVYHRIFGGEQSASMEHIRAAENADLLIVAPATANSIGKMASGIADDPLSTLFAAFAGDVLIAPAMNDNMWSNPAVQDNLRKLKMRGAAIVAPEVGELACGVVGPGRLADPATLLSEVCHLLAKRHTLDGMKILVTAGPTREPIDPVRFISNPSSGKMGYALAGEARKRGAEVVLVTGPTSLEVPPGVRVIPCQRAEEMRGHVLEHFSDCRVLIMTAAVGDFSPLEVSKEKIKKEGRDQLVLKLQATPDILMEVAQRKSGQFVVGFAAESENVVQGGLDKWRRKQLDLLVANDISAPGIGFQSDDNQVTLIAGPDDIEPLPRASKKEIAGAILDRIRDRIPGLLP